MDIYRQFILEAKIGGAAGFGKPSKKPGKPLSKQEIARWRMKSEREQEAYLKKFPNSKYRNVPKRGSIVTRSKKMSAKPWAKEMTEKSAEVLKSLGYRAKNNIESAKAGLKNLRQFLGSENRDKYIKKAGESFEKFRGKLNQKDRDALDTEAQYIKNGGGTTNSGSRILARRAARGVLGAIIGAAIVESVFALAGMGGIPSEVVAYIGIKALDMGIEGLRGTFNEPLSALVAGHFISTFFKSKDSDDYFGDVERKMSRKVGPVDDDNTPLEEPAKVEEKSADTKTEVSKQLGPDFDPNKYEEDENGNLRRKR